MYLEDEPDENSVTWGPFDSQMTVELTFYYKRDGGVGGWGISNIKDDMVKEVRDSSLLLFQILTF